MRRVITLPTHARPQYLRQVLDGLARCEGVKDYILLPFVDPTGDEETDEIVWNMAKSVSFCKCRPTRNQGNIGVNLNTYKALEIGFSNADFVIHLEDDIVPAPDMLRMFEYIRDTYRDDDNILTVTAYNNTRGKKADEEHYHALGRRQWFTGWGWATWEDRWQEIRRRWTMGQQVWDVWLNMNVRGERWEVYPHLSRTQNIGAEDGAHVPSPEWHRENQYNEEWAGKYDVPAGEWWELE